MEDNQFTILVLLLSCIFYVLMGADKGTQQEVFDKAYAEYRQSLIKWTDVVEDPRDGQPISTDNL